jgi:hypothetical protein
MGDFLNGLKAARYAPVAVRQRFRIDYDDRSQDVYAFFESTDDATFYRTSIAQQISRNGRLRVYLCGNKQSVWYHYQFAEQEAKLFNTVFFVDKDLDDFTGRALPVRGRIFVTDFYSVENYLCTENALLAALEQLVFLPNDGQRYEQIINTFSRGLDKLAEELRTIFCEVIALRRSNQVVSFNDLGDSLSLCFSVDDLQLNPLADWQATFRHRCKYDCAGLSQEDLDYAASLLSSKSHNEWIRGKFALWYFIQFLNQLWDSVTGILLNDRKKIKKTVDLKADSIFLTMQGRHPYPRGLEEFLALNIA